jgi:hypothetical protein
MWCIYLKTTKLLTSFILKFSIQCFDAFNPKLVEMYLLYMI